MKKTIGDDNSAMNHTIDGVAPLSHLGVLRAQGDDASTFLHNQLTQDFALLGADHARLAALCNAKGRMLASFIGIKLSPQDILLICNRDILPMTLKRLSMFVLRAKVNLSDASEDYSLYGLAGTALQALAPQGLTPWQRIEQASANLVGLYPAQQQPRALWVAAKDQLRPAGAEMPNSVWQWTEVQSGVATLSAATVEAFVPQMLNYESVDGINFKKGCYPGQEVVARSQFRGAIKRRTYLVHAEVALTAGEELWQADAPEQACGTVVQAVASPQGGSDALVCLPISVAEAAHVQTAKADAVKLLALPYPLRDDI